jgi:AraC family transcriptional regulator
MDTTDDFSAVAAQLVEAACYARDGDSQSAQLRIARAVELLDKQSRSPPVIVRRELQQVERGGFAAWQARRVKTHVDTHIAETIRLDDLAALLDLSYSHFCRLFKNSFGVTTHVYIMRRRIEVAQGLMLTTSEPLSDIALACGMSDQAHFTRSFRRIVGQTPYAWRKHRSDELRK